MPGTNGFGPGADAGVAMRSFRAGFVAIVGAPNAGKSTLVNRLAGQKIAIVSPKAQTTRGRILAVVHGPGYQAVFVDTPGVHPAQSALGRHLLATALRAIDEVDVVLFLVDARARAEARAGDADDDLVLGRLRAGTRPAILALNKIDALPKPRLLPLIDTFRTRYPFAEIVPISARDGDGVSELVRMLTERLPEGPPLFPPDAVTDQTERDICAELVREAALHGMREEVPHAIAVTVDDFDEAERSPATGGASPGLVRILATIHVERDSQKGIVIGKGGRMLRRIGTAARESVERFLGCRAFIGLTVRVEPRWTHSDRALAKLGVKT